MDAAEKADNLAMLYLQREDTSALTPAEFALKYKEVRKEIYQALGTGQKSKVTY